jgi:hypothetical protein
LKVEDPCFEFTNKGRIVVFRCIKGDILPFLGYDASQLLNKSFEEVNG